MPETKIAYIYMNGRFAGELQKKGHEFRFTYDAEYVNDPSTFPLSCSLPKAQTEFTDQYLLSFFEGLLTEGWLRRVQEETQKIDERDSFTRLVNNGEQLIGAVKVLKEKV